MTEKETLFNRIAGEYSERLYWHIRSIVQNHDDADDVLQNVFLKVWKNIDNFRGESEYFTWLWKIATNESISFLRKEKFKSLFSFVKAEDVLPQLPSPSEIDPDKAQAQFAAAIASLPPKQRAVFSMRYFQDLSYEEMSAITGTSEGALKASYHIAQDKIKLFIKNNV